MPSPLELDSAVLLIADDYRGSMDDWLEAVRDDGPPRDLPVTGAELVAEARSESEWE